MNRRMLILASLALLGGCAAQGVRVLAPAGTPFEELEPLFAAQAGPEALTITVASSGCTRKEDFAFFLERQGGAMRLAFGRRQLDRCRTVAPGKTDLSFTYEELGLDRRSPVFLLNPVLAWYGPGPVKLQ